MNKLFMCCQLSGHQIRGAAGKDVSHKGQEEQEGYEGVGFSHKERKEHRGGFRRLGV